ncbi:hypothetical protein ACHWQZ_G015943 [Mnemiopsis leidyi]
MLKKIPLSLPTFIILALLQTCFSSCPSSCSCQVDGTVNCTLQHLTEVPSGIPHDTKILDLSHNRLRDSSWMRLMELASDLDLEQLILTDNILTTIPQTGQLSVQLELSDNPIHCDCGVLALPPSLFLHDDISKVSCSTTSNPDVHNVKLSSLTTDILQCDELQLSVPVEITLYKLGSYDQVIPCHKSEEGTVFWRHKGELKYQTSEQDCSLVIRRMTTKDEGLYDIVYETPRENRTFWITVSLKRQSSKPEIDDTNTLLEVQRQGAVKLSCLASGAPPPSVEWFYNNRSLNNYKDDNIVMVDEKTIIVTDVTDEQVYTCRATNVLGVAETKFVVKTIDRIRGEVFKWLAPLSVALLIITGAGSVGYYFYSKRKLETLKQRCSSPGASDTGIIFENCDALPSTITQCEGYKMLAISTTSPPNQLICPITRECMKNPVVASDGFSYEEKAILAWFKRNGTSPMTNGEISKRLIQNHNLRTLIRDIMEKNSMSDSFINLDHLCRPSTSRGNTSRSKLNTSPSLSRISRISPEGTIIEPSYVSTSLENNSGSTAIQPPTDVIESEPRSSVSNPGPSLSTDTESSSGRVAVSSGVNPAADLSNVSTRDHRLRSTSSTNSRHSSSTDQGIGTSVTESLSEPLREPSSSVSIEVSEGVEGVEV